MNKLEGAKNFIQAADCIYEDYIVNMLEEDFTMYDEKELKIKINSYAEQCAKICEYYLKALILPNMKSPNFDVNSDEEMDYIANNKNGLRKYSHIFKKIINSEDFDENIKKNIEYYLLNHLPHFDEERKDITNKIAKQNGPIFELILSHNKLRLFPNSHIDINELLDEISGENGYISENSNAYSESRYSMITDYTADLSFLYVFCEAIRSNLGVKFNNCIEVEETKKHIFIDPGTYIELTFINDDSGSFYFNKNYELFIIDKSKKILDRIGHIWNFNGAKLNNDIIDKIIFIEDGNKRQLTLNKKTGKYYFANPDRIIYKDDQKEVNKILKKD